MFVGRQTGTLKSLAEIEERNKIFLKTCAGRVLKIGK
jgi:hypothetical protein